MNDDEATRSVVTALYDCYASGDVDTMLSIFDDDIDITFLAQGSYRGRDEITPFFEYSGNLLVDLNWTMEQMVVTGPWACVIWTETATTFDGAPWASTGVDVLRVDAGRVAELRMYNDAALSRRLFPPFVAPEGNPTGGH